MSELLCILLYLGVICSPCTYYESQIYEKRVAHQEAIFHIKEEPDYLEEVVSMYIIMAEEVVVIDDQINY